MFFNFYMSTFWRRAQTCRWLCLLASSALAAFAVGQQVALAATDTASCQQSPSPCGGNSTCLPTATYFKCACPKGYTYDRTLKTCVDVDECAVTNPPCVSPDDFETANNTRCVNTPGSFRCECPAGYQLTIQWIRRPYYWTYICTDLDECKSTPSVCGDPSATCVNREGSYVCRCPETTYWDTNTKTCVDVNECAMENPPCGGSSFCANTPGGYTCACPPDSGLAYVPSVDDCIADVCSSNPCGGNSTCSMATTTKYYCACAPGFAYNTTLRTCTLFSGFGSMTIEAGQVCSTDSTTCPISDGTTCGLYFAKTLKSTDNLSKTWPCNRLLSPNGKNKLVLTYNGQLLAYNGTKVVFQTAAASPRERRSLLLNDDGTWALYGIDVDWASDYSWYYGTTFAANTGPENGPFRMQMGNDGRVTIVNRLGQLAWTS